MGAVGGRMGCSGQDSCHKEQLADLIESTIRSVSGCVTDLNQQQNLPE